MHAVTVEGPTWEIGSRGSVVQCRYSLGVHSVWRLLDPAGGPFGWSRAVSQTSMDLWMELTAM